MTKASATHLLLLPSYDSGPRLLTVVVEALRHWNPVMVVVDGSTDGSDLPLRELARTEPALSVLSLPKNCGKGAAVLAGARAAAARGFTHILAMDADGQHPAASIAEFMEASQRQPAALVLGRPIFPANIPPERLHGRKLSVGLVHFELLGRGVADPLFGFRVYPIESLLRELGARRGGRRYDFDTEAAVRLAWSGLPLVNLAAPVRYFSRAEGGISHFHYLRDNLTLVWMHTRLITELLLWRWPTVRRHRRSWNSAAATVALMLLVCVVAHAAEAPASSDASLQTISASDPAWMNLAADFSKNPEVLADFSERRFFPFKKAPVELAGEVRVSATRGLSLHYTAPEERTVILDAQGVLIRAPVGEKAPPPDPRATAANEALLHLLHFDFAALEHDFTLEGRRDSEKWTLALLPRTDALRHSVGKITATGEAATIRHIEIRRTAKQAIEITIAAPRPSAAFTPDEIRRFFR